MKDVVGNFYTKYRDSGKRSLISLLGVSVLLVSSTQAEEKEVWYDAKGVPVLVKDKATGGLRKPTEKELEAYRKKPQTAKPKVEIEAENPVVNERVDLEAKLRESIANSNAEPTQSPLVADPRSAIPSLLIPKVYDDQRYYVPRSRFHSPFHQFNHPYIFRPTVPRFSRDGSYGPVRYYRPSYNRGYQHGCGNGYLLRYSRPGFTIRARF